MAVDIPKSKKINIDCTASMHIRLTINFDCSHLSASFPGIRNIKENIQFPGLFETKRNVDFCTLQSENTCIYKWTAGGGNIRNCHTSKPL